MFITRHFTILGILLYTFLCTSLFADSNYRSKYGFDIKGFKSNLKANIGWQGGLRTGRYFGTSQVYMGLGGYYGAPTGNSPARESLYYGGITLGYDGKLGKTMVFEIGFLGGYGWGEMKNIGLGQHSYFVMEPSLGAGFSLGGGWRITGSISYLHLTNAPTFSGPTFGFRLDNRSQTQVKDVND